MRFRVALTALLLGGLGLFTGCSTPDIDSGNATLTIQFGFDENGMYYTGGAVQEYELFLDDQTATPTFDAAGNAIFSNLPEHDDYRLVGAQRPCQTNCSIGLGNRRDVCELDLDITATATAYRATWDVGKPCTFEKISPEDLEPSP